MVSQEFDQNFDNTEGNKKMSFQDTDMWKQAKKVAKQLPNGFTVVSSDELVMLDDLLSQLDLTTQTSHRARTPSIAFRLGRG